MIRLKQFTEDDFESLISWINTEEELVQFAGTIFQYPLTKEQLSTYNSNPAVNAFTVIEEEENIPIGHCEIFLAENEIPRLCRIIIGNKNFRGKGIGRQIVNELLELTFNKYNAEKVELNVYSWNTSAIKTYENAGFKVNPAKKKEIFINGISWISLNMVINKNDYYSSKS